MQFGSNENKANRSSKRLHTKKFIHFACAQECGSNEAFDSMPPQQS